jgi:hypothetical protein
MLISVNPEILYDAFDTYFLMQAEMEKGVK